MHAVAPPAQAPGSRWTPSLAVLSLPLATASPPTVHDLPASPSSHADPGRDAELASLLQAAALGDARAFEDFYHRTVGVATAVVRRIAGNLHTEDVLADAYFQAWREAHRYLPERGAALSWMLTLARSRALDRRRAETLRHGGPGGVPDADDTVEHTDLAPGPESLLDALQTTSRLHAALSDLSSNERWVLGLAYYRDLSHSEIATLTDLPLGTVKSLVHRAQQKLRAVLVSPPVSATPADPPSKS